MRIEIAPGVSAERDRVLSSAEESAQAVCVLAETAAHSGTFGIGGLLLDGQGRVLARAVNAVLRDGDVSDPTAHVERQLVDWYFENAGRLPPAHELTLVSSLDPCAMCAGAILKAGLNAVAVAQDDTAGVLSYLRRAEKTDLRSKALAIVERNIRMFLREGEPAAPAQAQVPRGSISAAVLERCLAAFNRSLVKVRSKVAERRGFELPPLNKWLPAPDFSLRSGRTTLRETLEVFGQSHGLPAGFSIPSMEANVKDSSVHFLLQEIADESACFADEKGSIFLIVAADGSSPIRTGILELARAYPRLRASVSAALGANLPHPRLCSVVRRSAPDSIEDVLLEFGAMGSLLEAPRLRTDTPLLNYAQARQLPQSWVEILPEFYKEVRVSAARLPPLDLRLRDAQFAQSAG